MRVKLSFSIIARNPLAGPVIGQSFASGYF